MTLIHAIKMHLLKTAGYVHRQCSTFFAQWRSRSKVAAGGLLLLLAFTGCTSDANNPTSKAEAIIDQAQAAHGTQTLEKAVVEFDFRGKHFIARQDENGLQCVRTYTDDEGADVREVLTADSLYRTVSRRLAAALLWPFSPVVY